MAGKSISRSMRFSDEIADLIEEQPGDTFTAKFEWLVMTCIQELPKKQKELKSIKDEIAREGVIIAETPCSKRSYTFGNNYRGQSTRAKRLVTN